MLVTGIKSKPVYTTLKPAPSGLYHLLVGQGSGGEALLRLLREMPAGIEVHVLYATEPFSGKDCSKRAGPTCASSPLRQLQFLSQMAFKTGCIGGQGLPHAYRCWKKGKKEGRYQFLQV